MQCFFDQIEMEVCFFLCVRLSDKSLRYSWSMHGEIIINPTHVLYYYDNHWSDASSLNAWTILSGQDEQEVRLFICMLPREAVVNS